MDQTEFFFSSAVDLKEHSLSEQNINAMYTVHEACCAIDQPDQYGDSIKTIMITAVHQDYASKFHSPYIRYKSDNKILEAKVMVDLDQVLNSNYVQTVDIYESAIIRVLDQVKEEVVDFDFEKLKSDLHGAIQKEIKVIG